MDVETHTTMADHELVAAARAGDDAAFAALFRRHHDTALRVARRHAPADEVPDVVADVFTAVLGLLRRGAGPTDDVRAYLLSSVRHEAVRRARRAGRQVATDRPLVLDRVVHDPDPADRDAVHQALQALSPRQRTVLWYLEVEGYRPRELAALTGWSANAVSATAYRARCAMRTALDSAA